MEHPHQLSEVACPGVGTALWDAPLCLSQVLRHHLVMSIVAITLFIAAPSLFQAVTGPSLARLPQDSLQGRALASPCTSPCPVQEGLSPARYGKSCQLYMHPPFLLPPRHHLPSFQTLGQPVPSGAGGPCCPRCWEVPDGTDLQLESRRITHISAEQKRRFNIKLGFTTLHSLVSTLSAQPSIKVSTQGKP